MAPARSRLAWLLPIAFTAYVGVATRDWHVPAEGYAPFFPLWVGGSVIALAAWWGLRRHLTALETLAIGVVVAMVLTDVTTFWTQGLRDLHLYVKAGSHFAAGQPVYLQSLLTVRPADLSDYPYLYPPPTLPLFAVLSYLPSVLVDVAWVAGSIAAAVWALRRMGLGPVAVVLFLAWPPLLQGLYVGNVAVPLFAVFVAGPIFGAGLVVSAMFKPYSGIAALWLPREGRWRDLALGLAIVAAWIVLTLPLVGLDRWSEWWSGIGLYRDSQPLLPVSLYGFGLGRSMPEVLTVAIGIVVVILALRARREEGLWGLGVATIVASPSLFSHGFLVAIPAILGLRTTVFWVVMAITSVEPGGKWFVAIGILIAAWYLPALRGATVRLTVPAGPRSVRP
ncbi:MAG: glycosyltransferase 87 family protein [Candidatus Limnocylindrales bacterium]